MRKKIKYHLKMSLKRLMDDMLVQTISFLVLGFALIFVFWFFPKTIFLVLIWVLGLVYAISYFTNTIKLDKLVQKITNSSYKAIWLSKCYWC